MDQLAIGDTLQCLLPAMDGSNRRAHVSTCEIFYNMYVDCVIRLIV